MVEVLLLKVSQYTIALFFFYLLKQNRIIVHDEIHESYPGKSIYHKDPKFLDRSNGQTMQTDVSIGLIRDNSCHSAAHCCRTALTGQ